MTKPFGHEKSIVCQKGMRFAVLRSALPERLLRRVAACYHLDRGAESILLNIADGNGRFTGQDQVTAFCSVRFPFGNLFIFSIQDAVPAASRKP